MFGKENLSKSNKIIQELVSLPFVTELSSSTESSANLDKEIARRLA